MSPRKDRADTNRTEERQIPTKEYLGHNPNTVEIRDRDPETGAIVLHYVNPDLQNHPVLSRLSGNGTITAEQAIAAERFYTDYNTVGCGPNYATGSLIRIDNAHGVDHDHRADVQARYDGARVLFMGAALSLQVNVVGEGESLRAWCRRWNASRKAGQRPYYHAECIELLRGVLDDLDDYYQAWDSRAKRRKV